MNKYDDTDYQIEREESIEYEEIMSEEAFNDLIDSFEVVETLTVYGRKAIKQNVKKLQKRIKELEEHLKKYYDGELYTVKQLKQIEENQKKYFINKQKVKDKIEELKKHYNTDNNIRIYTLKDSYELQATVLEELLEEDKQ